MAQTYLHYKELKNKLEYDRVILIWVPEEDLIREINVSRHVGFGWTYNLSLLIQPRFIIENGELTKIPSPYKNLEEMVEDNRDNISSQLKEHLRKYDSFYYPFWHEPTPNLDDLLIVKLIKRYVYLNKIGSIYDNIINRDSEAVQITKKIIESMNREVKQEGGRFTLVILPMLTDHKHYSERPDSRKKWADMVSEICSEGIDCIDLMSDFQKIPVEHFDTGYDESHYGPKSNRLIADIIWQKVLN